MNRIVIADSLDDFLIKALDHMVKTENGFWYWLGPTTIGLVTSRLAD